MARITYNNKQQDIDRPNIPQDKKWTYGDANEVKDSVNEIYDVFQDFPTDGKMYGVKDGGIEEIGSGSGNYLGELADAPQNPEEGDWYKNTTTKTIERWNGVSWEVIVEDYLKYIPYHYPIVLVNGDEDLEEGDVLAFRLTFDGVVEKITLMGYGAPDGADLKVDVKINGVAHEVVINDGTLHKTLVPVSPISVSIGDTVEVVITQVGSVDPGKGLTMDLLTNIIN